MEKNGGGVGENTHDLEKNAKMLEKINTIIQISSLQGKVYRELQNKCLCQSTDTVTSALSERPRKIAK